MKELKKKKTIIFYIYQIITYINLNIYIYKKKIINKYKKKSLHYIHHLLR